MNETNEQQIPNLEEMDERQARQFLTDLYTVLSAEKEYALRHEDYVMEMPQSGERIGGREKMREFQEAYPTPPSIGLRRVLLRKGLWVLEGVNDYGGGRVSHVVVIIELKDGKMWRDTRYYAEPFEAPGWRSRWVEPMGSAVAPGDDGPAAGEGRETGEREIRRLVDRQFAMMPAGDFDAAHEWYDDGVIVEWPQSGERIQGKGNLLALRQAYPAGVGFEVRRITARRDLGVSEYVIRYEGRPVNVAAIAEFSDGKVVRETHYFADPFEAPEWRSRWVEKMDIQPPGSGRGAVMSAEENKAVVLRYIEEVWNQHDLGAIDNLVSSEYVNHAASTEEYRRGGARRIWEWILSVFPDHRFDVEDAAADGQTVAVRGVMVGTHEGELMGIAPTGKRVAAQQAHWFRVADGKVAEHWAVRDDLGMMSQLGVMPTQGQLE